jgi:hypothetical protein
MGASPALDVLPIVVVVVFVFFPVCLIVCIPFLFVKRLLSI